MTEGRRVARLAADEDAEAELLGPAHLGDPRRACCRAAKPGREPARGALLLWTIRPQDFGRAKQRRAEERASRIRSEDVRNRARGEIARAERDLEAARDAIPLAAEQAGAAEDNLRLVDANFRAGRALLLEVLDAQDELARARFTLAAAVSIYNAAQLRLLAATGTIDRSDFE